ncbi:MAG TPA: hypothetical protein VF796_05990 [Humisphaera sp.]
MADDAEAEDSGGEADDDTSGPWPDDGEIHYLNTDLDLAAGPDVDLAPLVSALELRDVRPMPPPDLRRFEGGWYVNFYGTGFCREPETTITAMLNAIEALSPADQALWDACTLRELNIGYDCGDRPWAFNQGISNDTLRRIAAAGLSLRITLYPPEASRSTAPSAAPPSADEP